MKYDKQAVVEQIEDAILRMQEAERNRLEKLQKLAKDAHKAREAARAEVRKCVASLSKKKFEESKDFNDLNLIISHSFGRAGSELADLRSAIATAAGTDWDEPVLDDSGSRELIRVLTVFKTGAPPEVSVTDLRAFGLMNFVKYQS